MTVIMTGIANWFRRRLGLASGIAASGFGFGGLLIPIIVNLIDRYDWRITMIILAGGVLAIVLPLSLFFRHRPEDYGYLPDGEAQVLAKGETSRSQPASPEINIKAKQALRSSTFWRISLAFAIFVMVVGATITHVMPYLSSINIPRTTSSLIATGIPLVSIGGRLGMGWLGDKFDRKKVAATGMAMMSVGMLCFYFIPSLGTWLLIPFLALFGTGYGGCSILRPGLAREYFGRRNFGTILGMATGVAMLGSISGAPLAGWVFDRWGSYQAVWLAFTFAPVFALLLLLTVAPVRSRR
jgi:sugar phosphate permease